MSIDTKALGYEFIRHCRFSPYRKGAGPVFVLKLYDTHRRDHIGKCVLAYSLTMGEPGRPGVTLFEGDDFACSPLHAIDSDDCAKALMRFLTLRPGDTDREYFDNYTPEQRDYCEQHAEALNCEVCNRFGFDN